jgi:4-diphosphocytidyl-2-C-methyl-D-erythritol kinase
VATVFSPAKINLFLAVTGRRLDGFHDLVSVVAPLDFGDELEAQSRVPGPSFAKASEGGPGSRFSLECNDPAVPRDGGNLILKAAELFAAETKWPGAAHFRLTKRIPMGAGLGGGSSNAVAALRALNRLAGGIATAAQLERMAAALGSDCTLFLRAAPVVMRGRGERVEPLPESAVRRLRGRRVLLFKPGFSISTAWAYARMAQRGTDYLPAADAERRLAAWLAADAAAGELLFNNLEPAAFEKFVALPLLLEKLRREFGAAPRMSGSGSACFVLLRDEEVTASMEASIRACWGEGVWMQKATLAQGSA